MTEFTLGSSKPRKLSKKEKVKRLLKKPVYNLNNFPVSSEKYTLPYYSLSFTAKETWRIPKSITASVFVQSKFIVLSKIFSYFKIVNRIKDSLVRIRFKVPHTEESFEVPEEIKSQISSYYTKQIHEWNKVRGIYLKLFRVKHCLSPLIYNWKIKLARKNVKNVEDPVTMEIPKTPVYVIDIKKRISFVYDAKTLRKTIESRLLFSDYMFAEPLEPVNLLTNEPLTYGQLISIFKQCMVHGEYSWVLDEFNKHGANIKKFTTFNKQRLNLEAIHIFFKKSTYVIRETVIDFFLLEADMANMPRYKITAFMRKYDIEPENDLVRRWIKNTREYYIAKELNDPVLLQKNDIDTQTLLNVIYLSIV